MSSELPGRAISKQNNKEGFYLQKYLIFSTEQTKNIEFITIFNRYTGYTGIGSHAEVSLPVAMLSLAG